jgi:hypothetical protein
VAIAIAVVGVVIGLIPLLFGMVGDTHVLYGNENEIEEYKNGSEEMTGEQGQNIQQERQAQQQQSLVRNIAGGARAEYGFFWLGLTSLFAILVAGIAGGIAAVQLSGATRDIVITATAGAFVGAFLFVFLGTFLATLGWETMPEIENARKASVQFTALLINSTMIGVLGAIAGGGSAAAVDALGE